MCALVDRVGEQVKDGDELDLVLAGERALEERAQEGDKVGGRERDGRAHGDEA